MVQGYGLKQKGMLLMSFELPNTWAGLYHASPSRLPCTFTIPYKGFVFKGIHSLYFEDELRPVVVTIETLYIDDSYKNVIDIIDPAITYLLEDELARNYECL